MLIRKVENYINENNLLEQVSRIVVGVSGGADSVCLLLILCELSKKMGFKITAVHINHMIRGPFADADEVFVRNLCEKLGVDFKSARINVPAYAKEHKLSEEEAGRIIRYEEFRKMASNLSMDPIAKDCFVKESDDKAGVRSARIAVAHNKDDQVETILFNIIRGSSLAGLGGMKPLSGDIIRPLLNTSRTEIEEFLNERHQAYRTDSTNFNNEYTRNKIRHTIIPAIKEINPNFGKRLIELAKDAALADEKITREAIRKKAAYLAIADVAGSKKDITKKHVESVLDLEEKQVGAKAHLPYELTAKKEYDGVKIYKEDKLLKKSKAESKNKSKNSGTKKKQKKLDKKLKKLNKKLKTLKPRAYNGEEIPNLECKKYIDYDKIEGNFCWRYREKGDIISLDRLCHKKLKDYMIDAKIPKEERDAIPLLADANNIIWVLGGRLSADYKVSKDTKNILIIDIGEK